MDARGRASFVFEDVTGRRWPRVKRIVLVLVVLGAVGAAGLAYALLSVAPGRNSPWIQAVGLAEQVRDWPQRGPHLGSSSSSGEDSSHSPSLPQRVAALPDRGRSGSAAGATLRTAVRPASPADSPATGVAPTPGGPVPSSTPAPAPSASATPGPTAVPLPTPIGPSPLPSVSPPPIPTAVPPLPMPTAGPPVGP